MSNKSVIQYLEGIESNVSNKSISEQIGEDFRKYLNNASVYYYESDLRKFNKKKKKSIYSSIIILSVIFILLLINIIVCLNGKHFDFFVLFYLFMMLCKIFDLILIIKTPNKRLASSNFNKTKIKFYEHNNKLEEETTSSFIFIGFRVVSVLLYLGSLFVFIITLNDNLAVALFNFMAIFFLARFTIPVSFNIKYSEYIFELDDSYVVTDLIEWKKYDK